MSVKRGDVVRILNDGDWGPTAIDWLTKAGWCGRVTTIIKCDGINEVRFVLTDNKGFLEPKELTGWSCFANDVIVLKKRCFR